MTDIPEDLLPWRLVHHDGLSEGIQDLVMECREACETEDWKQAQNVAKKMIDLIRDSNDRMGLAVAQIYLGDSYREDGDLESALDQFEEAYRILRNRPIRPQRHNIAVAAYALGCVNRLIAKEKKDNSQGYNHKTLDKYVEALTEFEKAEDYWVGQNAKERKEECARVRQWIRKQVEKIRDDISSFKPSQQQILEEEREQFLTTLRSILTDRLLMAELETWVYDLGFNKYVNLSGKPISSGVIALVDCAERHQKIPELIDYARRKRPNIDFSELGNTEIFDLTDPPIHQNLARRAKVDIRQLFDDWVRELSREDLKELIEPAESEPEESKPNDRPDDEDRSCFVTFDIWRVDSADARFARYDDAQGYLLDGNRALISDRVYAFFPVFGNDLPVINRANYHFALPVHDNAWTFPETEPGDFVFVHLQWPIDREEGRAVVWKRGEGWLTVDFERDTDGNIVFRDKTLYIIGGDPEKEVEGYIVALLKPE